MSGQRVNIHLPTNVIIAGCLPTSLLVSVSQPARLNNGTTWLWSRCPAPIILTASRDDLFQIFFLHPPPSLCFLFTNHSNSAVCPGGVLSLPRWGGQKRSPFTFLLLPLRSAAPDLSVLMLTLLSQSLTRVALLTGPVGVYRRPAHRYRRGPEPRRQHIWSFQQSGRTEQPSPVALLSPHFSSPARYPRALAIPCGLSSQRHPVAHWPAVPCCCTRWDTRL